MIKSNLSNIMRFFFPRKVEQNIQTFTYFIPASSKERKSGYREREFDQILYDFLKKGFEVISINTESHSPPSGQSGMWIICLVRPTNKKTAVAPYSSTHTMSEQSPKKIEGLYQINEQDANKNYVD